MKLSKVDMKEVKKFGFFLTIFLLIISLLSYFKGHETRSIVILCIDIIVLLANVFYVPIIKPIYIVAMKIALILGYINTKIILCVVYYLVFTPIRLIMKIVGKDLLDEKIEKNIKSYWKDREVKRDVVESYERLF